jgi:predicted AAA+ superfamily ATPase
MVFDSLPRHLSKENKKFSYGVVKKGARGRELDDALRFLIDAGLVVKVGRVSTPGLPLSAYEDESAFKLFCVDLGLLGALAGLDSRTVLEGSEQFTHFKGALAEQYVCQQLVSEGHVVPHYWSSSTTPAEVDFVVEIHGEVVPVEVKADENLRAKSLATFCKANGLTNAVRLSLSGFRRESWMTNVPLYAACHLAQGTITEQGLDG